MARRVVGGQAATKSLLERESELSELGEMLEGARAGEGRVAVIEGPPGIGKTRLADAVREAAKTKGFEVLSARGGDLERDLPFGVARQLFERRLRRTGARSRKSLLAGPAELCAAVVLDRDGVDLPAAAPDQAFAVLHGLYWLTSNLAEQAPLLICVDDAHWSDPASLRFLHYLSRRVDDLPVLVVVTLRSSDPEAEAEIVAKIRGESAAIIMRPAPLSPVAVAALVRAGLGGDSSAQLCDACHAATQGNPFLAHELIGELEVNGIAPDADPAVAVSRLVPDAVARNVLARVARLPTEVAELARTTALLGTDVDLPLASELAGLDLGEATDSAEALVRSGLFRPGSRLDFVHPLIREAVYVDLPAGERARSHRRAAELLRSNGAPGDRIAAQLVSSPPAGERWAVEALRDAATEAMASGSPESAVAFLRRALEESPSGERDPELLGALGGAEVQARIEDGIDHLRLALELAPDDDRVALARELALAYVHFLRQPEAVEVLTRELGAASAGADEGGLELEAELASTLLFGMDEAMVELDARLARITDDLPLDTAAGRGLSAAAAFRKVHRGENCQPAAETAGCVLERGLMADVGPGSTIYFSAIMTLASAGAFAEARQWAEEGLRRSQASGFPLGVAMNLNLISWIALRCGEIAEAEATAANALSVVREFGIPLGHPAVIASLVDALVARGEAKAAWDELARDGLTGGVPDVFTSSWLLESRGRLRTLQADHDGALADYLAAGESFRRWGVTGCEPAAWRSHAAESLLILGRADEAAPLAEEDLALARRFGAPRPLGRALRVSGLLTRGTEGLDQLRDAVDVLQGSEARLDLVAALFDLGAAMRRSGQRVAARVHLRPAVALAHECGASALEERVHQELLSTGARPRRIPVTGVESLTPSERRIAALAAEGRSNREIAQALFVSLKTVEMHLSSAYRKLDLSSRSELPRTLGIEPGDRKASHPER